MIQSMEKEKNMINITIWFLKENIPMEKDMGKGKEYDGYENLIFEGKYKYGERNKGKDYSQE